MAEELWDRAESLNMAGRVDEAVAMVRMHVKLRPKDLDAVNLLGSLLQQAGQIHQVAVGGLLHGQQLIHQLPVGGIERMGLERLGHGCLAGAAGGSGQWAAGSGPWTAGHQAVDPVPPRRCLGWRHPDWNGAVMAALRLSLMRRYLRPYRRTVLLGVAALVAVNLLMVPKASAKCVTPEDCRTLARHDTVLVGARSALFLPFANLRLIIVDEAHETSFKQEDGVQYHARDAAVMRGHFEKIPVVLATATPAIETRQQVAQGRYAEIKLPGRYGAAQMPTIEAINLIETPPERGRWLAPPLVNAITQTLARKEQVLLFLNRRGYAPLTLCRHCGHRFQCPNCTAWMVEHRLTNRLQCHHCGHIEPPPSACPECHTEDSLVACGPGVERISDEVGLLFPEARRAIVTSDTLWSPAKAAEFVGRMEAGEIDIVIGTQLITKGYHFPELTLVGVVDADLGLQGGDLRAAERTFQLMRQVAGRAGRGEKPGEVLIQTRHPDAPVIAALADGDRDAFYAAETAARRDAGAPPFGRWAAIILSSEDEKEAREAAIRLNGDDLKPLSVMVDGAVVTDWRMDGPDLVVPLAGDKHSLTIETAINPGANTQLMGLYASNGMLCTQCEAEGFRRITFFPDRPDVLSRYTVRMAGDKVLFPILLCNGNRTAAGEGADGTHWAEWHDPWPKPSYLFALVAGDLVANSKPFTTCSGRVVECNVWVRPEDIARTDHALESLHRSMTWDEKVFGREYDLDLYNIVAVSDFNMGAMENKGLNVFNTRYVLADPETATDTDYDNVEGVIAHEYFHNWSGNRVTCRDWFQLSLKEGFTVLRDQLFSQDMRGQAVKRIEDVRILRAAQFPEDAGPLAHPIRPDSYREISNFYTATVYNKGAEVIRMMRSMVGEGRFRAGTDLYFDRHDGEAATCEDFVKAIEDGAQIDLTRFRRWYSQAGTPRVHAEDLRTRNPAAGEAFSAIVGLFYEIRYGGRACSRAASSAAAAGATPTSPRP